MQMAMPSIARFAVKLFTDKTHNTAETSRLIASRYSVEKICSFLGADSLGYLSEQGLLDNKYLHGGFCTYCFNGKQKI